MAALNFARARQCLKSFDFVTLFTEELGWDRYRGRPLAMSIDGLSFTLHPVAEKRGMVVLACDAGRNGNIPEYRIRRKIEREVAKSAHEHVIIYVDGGKNTQRWQWVRREPGKPVAVREHVYDKGQAGDALIQKLQAIAFDLDEEDSLTIAVVAGRARQAFDVERVTKQFYDRFKSEHETFLQVIKGIRSQADREWYASLMLNRLMFVYFIQKKGFLDGDYNYLRNRLEAMRRRQGRDRFLSFYRHFLLRLFHEGLGTRSHTSDLDELLGKVPYLNGGLFDVHQLERENQEIEIPDAAFEHIFAFFDAYQWHLDERPLRADNEINPDVLGYIFEKYINQKLMGAYYTKDDITGYIARNTILPFILQRVMPIAPAIFEAGGAIHELVRATPDRYVVEDLHTTECLGDENERERDARLERYQSIRDGLDGQGVESIEDLTSRNLDAHQLVQDLIETCDDPPILEAFFHAVEGVSILDPTCGSGAFLFAALKVLEPLYEACLDRMERFLEEAHVGTEIPPQLREYFDSVVQSVREHPSRRYFVLKSIVINNLYGVDIMEEAVEICKLRLFLKLMAQLDRVEELEPLPDIDFNIRPGNTLVGFATYEDAQHVIGSTLDLHDTAGLIQKRAQEVDEAYRAFRHAQTELEAKEEILRSAKAALRERLESLDRELDEWAARERGVDPSQTDRFERWRQGHHPFHWFTHFYGLTRRGGFDIVIGNPPYVGLAASAVSEMCGVATPFARLFARFKTVDTGNLYAPVLERSLALLAPTGRWGFIVPLSITFSRDFKSLRELIQKDSTGLWYSSFDNIPDRAFTGAKESENTSKANQQRVTIVIGTRVSKNRSLNSTPTQRWRAKERKRLFGDFPYADVTALATREGWPKIAADGVSSKVLSLVNDWPRLGTLLVRHSKHRLVVPKTAGYYIAAYEDPKERSKQMTLCFRDAEARKLACVLLNSNFFFWWYRVWGDGFDVTGGLVASCPVPPKPSAGFEKIADALFDTQRQCTVYKAYRGDRVPNVNYNLRMDLLYEADSWVWSHFPKEIPFDWEALLRYKSSSWFSFEIAKSQAWPGKFSNLGARSGVRED